ncbi:3-hydroxyacyl-CoA dehydrogenase NAD-binding domain-containing protein, partial [uncultured Intestinimonas sp.]|uniref:3-hydroxyacyl-CoA dehydrogenase NAD-binding domain-containing protein n=1 Tax=uncultured Intestinimonas sp. TaxID=1689265 RepID=UPI00345B5892
MNKIVHFDASNLTNRGYAIMKKIVVIGGGTMGLDIAQVFAKKGFDVVVRDIKDEIIQASEARLNKSLDKLVSKGKLDEAGKKAITDKMTFTTDL